MRGCSKRKQHDSVSVFTCSMAWPTTTDTRVKRLFSDTVPPRLYWFPALQLKHSLALKRTAEQMYHPHVSGPLASQTDRRKTVACYVINTTIIKIRGVLDSVCLYILPSWDGNSNTPQIFQNQTYIVLYVQSAQGQKAKASLSFAGVVYVIVTEIYCKENKKNPEAIFFKLFSNDKVSKGNGIQCIMNVLGQL